MEKHSKRRRFLILGNKKPRKQRSIYWQIKLLMKGELAALGKRAAGTGNLFHCTARRGKP